jgi:hypothetical protein
MCSAAMQTRQQRAILNRTRAILRERLAAARHLFAKGDR